MVVGKEGDGLQHDDQQPQGGLGYQVSFKECKTSVWDCRLVSALPVADDVDCYR